VGLRSYPCPLLARPGLPLTSPFAFFGDGTVFVVPVPGAKPLPGVAPLTPAFLWELRPLSLDDRTISLCCFPGDGPL
jgi:hypothetical protein